MDNANTTTLRKTAGYIGRMALGGLMCLIVSLSVSAFIDHRLARFGTQLACLILFTVMIYPAVQDEGSHDANGINYAHETPKPLRGVLYGLWGCVPGWLVFLPLLAARLGVEAGFIREGIQSIYRLLNPVFYGLNSTLLPHTLSLHELPWWVFAVLFLETLLPLVLCGFGYALGLARVSMFERMIYRRHAKA